MHQHIALGSQGPLAQYALQVNGCRIIKPAIDVCFILPSPVPSERSRELHSNQRLKKQKTHLSTRGCTAIQIKRTEAHCGLLLSPPVFFLCARIVICRKFSLEEESVKNLGYFKFSMYRTQGKLMLGRSWFSRNRARP